MTPRHAHAPAPDSDLDWEAYLYATGALDGPAASAFEDRLDHDQAAREALAGAVALADAAALAAAARARARRRRSLAGLAAAAAVALAATLTLAPRRPGTPADPGDVALTWSSLRPAGAEGDPLAWLDEPGDADPDDHDPDADPPGWLLEAAALRPGS